MLVSELIKRLQELQSQVGNVDVLIDDADTHWSLPITDVIVFDGHIEIGGDYK